MATTDELKIQSTASQQPTDQGLFQTTAAPATTQQPVQNQTSNTGLFTTQPGADTVSQQLNDLLEANNPYLVAARESAQRTAASRGLQNSSIAATAGEKAAIESALPIAQQDANYYQQMGLNRQTTENQKQLYELQGDISSRLSAQEHQQAQAIQAAELAWNQSDLSQRLALEREKLKADDQIAFNELANKIGEDYMNDFMELAVNPNFDTPADRQKAIDILTETYNQRYQIAADLAGYTLEWSTPTIDFEYRSKKATDPDGNEVDIADLVPAENPGIPAAVYTDGQGNYYTEDGKLISKSTATDTNFS